MHNFDIRNIHETDNNNEKTACIVAFATVILVAFASPLRLVLIFIKSDQPIAVAP